MQQELIEIGGATDRFSRNGALLRDGDQERLAAARVAVCGVGGMGGVCAELLARMGIGHLIVADLDTFERSNINRQIHADERTLGQNKASVIGEHLRAINPDLDLDVITEGVTPETIPSIIDGAEILVNGMDQMRASLMLERAARRARRTIVDAWLTPYASVFVMTPDSPHWEEYLELPTRGIPDDELTEALCREATRKEVQYTLSFGDPWKYITKDLVEGVVSGEVPRPSLGPVVWLSGVMMANEVFKLVVGLPTTNHVGIIYDQYEHRMLLNGHRS